MWSMQKLYALQGKVGGQASEPTVNLKKQTAAIHQGVRTGGRGNCRMGITAFLSRSSL